MESKNKHQMFHQNIPYLDAKELDCGHHILKIFPYEILMLFVLKYQQICSICNISWIFNLMFIKKNAQRKPENKQMLSLITPIMHLTNSLAGASHTKAFIFTEYILSSQAMPFSVFCFYSCNLFIFIFMSDRYSSLTSGFELPQKRVTTLSLPKFNFAKIG